MYEYLKPLAIGVAVFAVLLVLWLFGRKKRGDDSTTAPASTFTGNAAEPMQPIDAFAGEKSNIPPGAFEAEVRMLIDYGNKIAAIRVVREKMGLDLKDAKDLVDRMEQGAPISAATDGPPHASAAADDTDRHARTLIDKGHLLEAIKLVREQKGLDLKEAKAYVDRLQQ